MPGHRFPAFDLPQVVFVPSALVVTAVPLEPSTRVVLVNPVLLYPVFKWLTGLDLEEVELGVIALWAELCLAEPVLGEFLLAIGHVFSTKDSKGEHFFGSEFWFEVWVEVLPGGFAELVLVVLLESVTDGDGFGHDFRSLRSLVAVLKFLMVISW